MKDRGKALAELVEVSPACAEASFIRLMRTAADVESVDAYGIQLKINPGVDGPLPIGIWTIG